MAKHGKKYRAAAGKVEQRPYQLDEAFSLLKQVAFAKFNETVELSMLLGVDPKHADQMVRGTTVLPHGTGQSKRVLEVTPQGQIAWEFNATDAPSLGLAWICDVQVLKSGNLLVTNWVGANGGVGVHAFEVTRDKRVVYQYDDHALVKSATSVVAPDD